MKRFEIWVANLPDHLQGHVQCGRRPIIIVSNDEANLYSPVVSVVPLTSKLKKKYQPTHVIIRGYGLKKSSNALCETILTVDKCILERRIGVITKETDRAAIQKALAVQLNLDLGEVQTEQLINWSVLWRCKDKVQALLYEKLTGLQRHLGVKAESTVA